LIVAPIHACLCLFCRFLVAFATLARRFRRFRRRFGRCRIR